MGHNGGRACAVLDLAIPTYYCPFLNLAKSGNGFQAGGAFTGDWRTLFDANGYPTAMPAGGAPTWVAPQIWVFGVAGDTWVLDWPGTATMHLTINFSGGSATENIISANRREYVLAGSPIFYDNFPDGTPEPALLSSITITSMAANNFATPGAGIRLYLKNGSPSAADYEGRINAGEIFDPRFTAIVGKFGTVHYENWNLQNISTQGSLGVGKWADRKTIDAYSWYGNGEALSSYWCGVSGGTNAITVSQPPSAIASWTQGQKIQFQLTNTPVWSIPVQVTAGVTTTFKSPSHGLTAGDKIQFAIQLNAGWRSMSDGGAAAHIFWTVTVTDADHFTIPFDSSGVGGNPYPQNNVTAFTGSISGTTLTVSAISAGTITPTQILTGAGITACSIVSQSSGVTGGAGVYVLSVSQGTIGSEAMVTADYLPFIKVIAVQVGSVGAVPCCMVVTAGNFSPNFGGWGFGQNALTAGDIVDGIYDAGMGCLLLDNMMGGVTRFVPIEVIVNFSNTTGSRPYFNLSPIVDDDYVTQHATYLHANLAVGLDSDNELSNEVWNFSCTGFCQARALADLGAGGGDYNNWVGKRSAEVSSLFKAVYGGTTGYKVLIAVQSGSGLNSGYIFNTFVVDRMLNLPYTGKTATITIANPAVVSTSAPHGYVVDDQVALTTTGALPAPFHDNLAFATQGAFYFVVSVPSPTSVQLAATRGGAAISTVGGTQSGTHTIARPSIMDCHGIAHAPYLDSPILQGNCPLYPNQGAAGCFADQVWNNSLGGIPQQAAFDFYKASLLNASLDEVNFPSGLYINKHLTNVIPFWKSMADLFGKDLREYEGGQNVFGSSNEAGFPYTIANGGTNNGQSVTPTMVRQFMREFYASQQFADCISAMFYGSAARGTKFPAQYTIEGPQQKGGYWAIQRLNTTYNGFVDSPQTLAYQALRAFNDPVLSSAASALLPQTCM